jgi:hypothetical protein
VPHGSISCWLGQIDGDEQYVRYHMSDLGLDGCVMDRLQQ